MGGLYYHLQCDVVPSPSGHLLLSIMSSGHQISDTEPQQNHNRFTTETSKQNHQISDTESQQNHQNKIMRSMADNHNKIIKSVTKNNGINDTEPKQNYQTTESSNL